MMMTMILIDDENCGDDDDNGDDIVANSHGFTVRLTDNCLVACLTTDKQNLTDF